ncbi:GTP-binding protein HflX [Synechococcus sp. PCC 7502]|nr:GTP-binding protein HflX [Synechococcus sp. PCC 7502]
MENIYGDTQGLKPSQIKQLERLYRQRLPIESLTTPEFAQRLAGISSDINKPVCVFVNRRGQVIRVGLGTPNHAKIPLMELPRYGEERLCGLRCIATNLKHEPPSITDLTAMAMQRLDSLITVTITSKGYVDRAYTAHILPESIDGESWYVSPPQSLDAVSKQDFLELVSGLEDQFRREYKAQVVEDEQDRVILVGLITSDASYRSSHKKSTQKPQELLSELGQLVDSAGGVVLSTILQKRDRPHPQTVLGEGKVQEIALAAQTQGANLIVFDRELSPAQIRNLERLMGIRVSDRTEVILDIFAQRAQSAAGKLQVELAQLQYRLPRLAGRGMALSRLGGGIGTRGPGETKLETDRRVIQKRITQLQHQVDQLQSQRARMRQQRIDQEIPTVAIVGYTNAGKSTLLNALTKSTVYAADKLFATLDPTTRRLHIRDQEHDPNPQTILITDTVGFIHELPPPLVNAFRATLEEVTEADVLIHLVDISHEAWESQLEAVNQILADMPIAVGATLTVFNKIDAVPDLDEIKAKYPDAIYVSAMQRQGLDQLLQELITVVKAEVS